MKFVGLDLGTSSLKAIVVDEDQQMLGERTEHLQVLRPHDGWAEQDPESWCAAALRALDALSAEVDFTDVAGIGLSGHMHGATLIGSDDRPLRHCMLWNDTRSHVEAAQMDADPQFREITGNVVFPGFTAPKVEWVRRNEPAIFDRTAKVLLPKDYLRLFLTGEHISDMSDAAGTAWLDTGARDWSDTLLSACHLGRDQMPDLVEGSHVAGQLRPALSERFGMGRVVLAGGAGDNAAAAIGAGVVRNGTAFVSLGTSGVLFAAADAYRPAPATAVHSFCHAVPDTWHQMGVILAATDALEWLSRLTGQAAADLTRDLGDLRAPAGPLFLPYLGGERTPHNNSTMRGQFLDLDHGTDAHAATRAVLEGVSFAFADCQDALAATGTTLSSALALGGGARSEYWLKLLATVLDITLEVPDGGEFGAAMGAARLGQMAATGASVEIATMPAIFNRIEPNRALSCAFDEQLERYREAYRLLRPLCGPRSIP